MLLTKANLDASGIDVEAHVKTFIYWLGVSDTEVQEILTLVAVYILISG
jgi:hypothetical protein